MTLEALKKHFEDTYKIEVSMITYGSATVYTSFDKNTVKRLPMLVPEAIETLHNALPEILNKTRNVRDGVQILRTVRSLLLNNVGPAEAIATAVASKRLKHTFKNVNALLAKPELLEIAGE